MKNSAPALLSNLHLQAASTSWLPTTNLSSTLPSPISIGLLAYAGLANNPQQILDQGVPDVALLRHLFLLITKHHHCLSRPLIRNQYVSTLYVTWQDTDTSQAQPLEITPARLEDSGDRFVNLDRPPVVQSASMSGESTSKTDTAFTHSTDNPSNPSELPEIEQPQPRYTYRDIKGVLREVWQPGDGDGVPNGELPDALTFIERFRFFQSNIGPIVRGSNSPPKFVILDDQSCYDIWKSNLYKVNDRSRYWCHDFSIRGAIKHGRPNRGHAVLMSAKDGGDMIDRNDSYGPREVGWAPTGNKKQGKKYHFTGEGNGYEEIKFGIPVGHSTPLSGSQEQPQPGGESGTGQQREKELEQSAKAKGKRKAPSTGARQQNDLPSTPSPKHKRTRGHAYLRKSITPSPPQSESRFRDQGITKSLLLTPFPTIPRSVSVTGTRPAPKTAFIDSDSSSSTPPPRAANAKKSGARTVYAGMTYHYQDDSNFPTVLGGNSYAAGGAGSRRPRVRTPVPADPHDVQEAIAEYDEQYNGRNMQRGGEKDYRFDPQLPIWMSVKAMEDALHDAKRRLISRDDEIAGLRREIARLRDMCVERLRGRDDAETEVVGATSEKSREARTRKQEGQRDGEAGADPGNDEKEIKVESEEEEVSDQGREMLADTTTQKSTTELASSKMALVAGQGKHVMGGMDGAASIRNEEANNEATQNSTWGMANCWMGPLRLGKYFH